MGAFGSNFPDFRAIWLGTTKPKLQNLYEATNQNIRTFTSTKGYLWLTGTSWIDSAPSEPSNSNMFGRYRPGGGQMPNSDRSAQSINFGLFLRKAGGISNLMRTLQNLDLSTTARNFLGPFSESARNFRFSGCVRTCKYPDTGFFDEPICRMPIFEKVMTKTDLTYKLNHTLLMLPA